MSSRETPDKGTYLGLKALDPNEWEAGYKFALIEGVNARTDWEHVNNLIARSLQFLPAASTASWWCGYGYGWMKRDRET